MSLYMVEMGIVFHNSWLSLRCLLCSPLLVGVPLIDYVFLCPLFGYAPDLLICSTAISRTCVRICKVLSYVPPSKSISYSSGTLTHLQFTQKYVLD